MGKNIGVVTPKVVFLSRGPFFGQPKQEVSYYYNEEVAPYLKTDSCEKLPSPINGMRLREDPQNYDNWLSDSGDSPLEDALYTYKDPVSSANDDGSVPPVNRQTNSDPPAKKRAEEVLKNGKKIPFFVWNVAKNLFGDVNGGKFDDPSKLYFTYALKERPGDTTKATFLTPFFTKNITSKDPDTIHWGAQMKSALPFNQPFEVTYYFDERIHNIPTEVSSKDTLYPALKKIFPNLAGSAYFGVEFGKGGPDNYLLLFIRGQQPVLFKLGQDIVVIARYSDPASTQRLFDQNSKFFSVKVEAVLGSFIISSNVFGSPWVIKGSIKGDREGPAADVSPYQGPYYVGVGQVAVYGGNVQAGWCMRPIQYVEYGSFKTPPSTFSSITGGNAPRASVGTKGGGGGAGSKSVRMADSENVECSGEKGVSLLKTPGISRTIRIGVSGKDKGGGLTDYYADVELEPSDVNLDGYTLTAGRSPYIWLTRLESGTQPGSPGGPFLDVTTDVLSIDLSFNATSYNEVVGTGTLKLLNKLPSITRDCPRVDEYRKYMDRCTYVKVACKYSPAGAVAAAGTADDLFEGMTVGANLDIECGKEIMVFKLSDYMNVLEHSKFENCPTYDGMVARLVVKDIMDQTGFPESRMKSGTGSLGGGGGRPGQELVLPLTNIQNEPQYKYPDGSSFKEGILKLARYDFKTIFFDRHGDFHYDPAPDIFGGPIKIKESFVTSPKKNKDPFKCAWNSYSIGRSPNDVYNVIRVDSVDRVLGIRITSAALNSDSIRTPTALGYLGFRKMLLVREAALGSQSAVERYVAFFRRTMFIPPYNLRFEVYGRPGLQPMDIVKLNNQNVRIMNITYDIQAETNRFWMTIEGEWFDKGPGGGGDGVGGGDAPTTSGS